MNSEMKTLRVVPSAQVGNSAMSRKGISLETSEYDSVNPRGVVQVLLKLVVCQ